MTAYWAVIRDSFREALASRILWLLLILMTLLLLGVAPLSYREDLTVGVREGDVRDWAQLLERVRTTGAKDQPSPERHLWLQLEEPLRKQIAKARIPGQDPDASSPFEFIRIMGDFQQAVDGQLRQPDFYDPASWKQVAIYSDEARELLRKQKPRAGAAPDAGTRAEPESIPGGPLAAAADEGAGEALTTLDPTASAEPGLSDSERLRLNRLMFEAAFPEEVRTSPPTSLRFTYAGMQVGSPYPLRSEQFSGLLKGFVAWVLKWFVGALGVFVAVLVTAPIVPQMFDQGSLHLLLSKPVSRWLLFLAKYLGGCAFILIGASYLIGGAWLILGLRFGVWDAKLLLSIPIYLFVFAIYYAVAALAGVVWRSAVVSVAISLCFWLVCFTVGVSKSVVEANILSKNRFAQVVFAGETPLGVDERGIAHAWNEQEGEWEEVFVSSEQKQLLPAYYMMGTIPRELKPIGPVYDRQKERLVAAMRSFQRGKIMMLTGAREEDWECEPAKATAPLGTFELLPEAGGRLLAISNTGLHRLEGSLELTSEPVKVFGVALPFSGLGPFLAVSPEPPLILTQPASAHSDPDVPRLVTYSRATVTLLQGQPGKRYERVAERKLEGDERQPALLAIGGKAVLVGREDGRVLVWNAADLSPRSEFVKEGQPPRFLAAAPGGRWFAVLLHGGELYLLDTQTDRWEPAPVRGQEDISAVAFPDAETLVVADRANRLTWYTLPHAAVAKQLAPPAGLLHNVYHYGLLPLYTLFPKPGELDRTFEYVLSEKTSTGGLENDLTAARREVHPWTPVWSSLAFTLVILGIACFYIQRQEF